MSGIQHIAGKYTRERAVREIAQNELWPYSLSGPAGSTYPFHHHETDETVYLIVGELLFTEEETDRQYAVRAGDKLFIPARHGHTVKAIANATYIMALKEFIPLEEFPVWHEPVNQQTFFDTLAHQFADAEQYPAEARDYSATLSRQLERNPESGEQFYKRVLAQGLKFRRAGGPPAVNTSTFLKGLINPDNRTDKIAVSDVEVIEYSRDLVLTAVVVTLTGRRGGTEINGKQYRNVRIFRRDPGEWRCVLWFNTPL